MDKKGYLFENSVTISDLGDSSFGGNDGEGNLESRGHLLVEVIVGA
jgi:hypothetical protein